MATLNDYFRTEARDFLTAVERGLERQPAPDAAELHRATRGLRGTMQMARAGRILEVVSGFETVTRSLSSGTLDWSDDVAQRMHATVADLRTLLDGTAPEEHVDGLIAGATARWRDLGSEPARAHAASPGDGGTRAFREFAAREAAGIADELDRGVRRLQDQPMDREPLKAILRRQRALLGSARLDEIPIVAEILRAVEDLTRVVAKLDIGVKREWLDIYRVARDGLQTTIAPLLRDEVPEPTHSVSRLRHMHEELLERYGGEATPQPQNGGFGVADAPRSQPVAPFIARPQPSQPTAPEPDTIVPDESGVVAAAAPTLAAPVIGSAGGVLTPVTPTTPSPVPEAPAVEVVESVPEEAAVEVAPDAIEIDTLSYTREDALQRALELYDTIARGVARDPKLAESVEELFDLIRMALG